MQPEGHLPVQLGPASRTTTFVFVCHKIPLDFLCCTARTRLVTSTTYKSIKDVRLLVLAGVEEANLDGEKIVGTWKELKPRFSLPGKTVVQSFANWRDGPNDILSFTRVYGFLEKPDRSGNFEQSLQEWREHQAFIRRHWRPSLGTHFGMKDGEMLHVKGDQLSIEAESLRRFIEIELFITPNTHRRICSRPDCKQDRYFIAVNTKQRFCSRECVEWGLRQHKKEWWRENGPQWRQNRKAKN